MGVVLVVLVLFFFPLGGHMAVWHRFRFYLWLCTQGSSLEELRGSYVVPGIKSRSTAYKSSTLPVILSVPKSVYRGLGTCLKCSQPQFDSWNHSLGIGRFSPGALSE